MTFTFIYINYHSFVNYYHHPSINHKHFVIRTNHSLCNYVIQRTCIINTLYFTSTCTKMNCHAFFNVILKLQPSALR